MTIKEKKVLLEVTQGELELIAHAVHYCAGNMHDENGEIFEEMQELDDVLGELI